MEHTCPIIKASYAPDLYTLAGVPVEYTCPIIKASYAPELYGVPAWSTMPIIMEFLGLPCTPIESHMAASSTVPL